MKRRLASSAVTSLTAACQDVGRISPEEQIKDLGDAVQDRLKAGNLSPTQANEPMDKLGQATKQLGWATPQER